MSLQHSNSGTSEEVFVLPASLAQERYWALDRMLPGNPTWSVPVRFRLQGELRTNLVERAFNAIVARHETLRTTFLYQDGALSQVIKPALELSVPVTDLRHLPRQERDAEADKLSFKEARTGFDLACGPLFRASLLRVDDQEHVLLVTPHHSVADYLSVGLISTELGILYEAYARGSDPVLPEFAIQYGDYAIWQKEQTETAAVKKEMDFWKEQLAGLPLLDFPTDRPRQSSPTYEATITSILLPVDLTDALRQIGARYGATFFNTALAALAIVLQHYTGQVDFGVATQVAGRNTVELEKLIGVFINTVVLRMDVSGDPGFPDLLARTQETGTQSLAHQDLRFEQLLREVRPQEYPSHHSLFRVNFICQRDPVKPLEFSGVKLTVIPSKCQGALYDLNIFWVQRNEGWRLACEYNTDLYDAGTITGLLSNYRSVVEQIVNDPERPVSRLSLPHAPKTGTPAIAPSQPSSGNARDASTAPAPATPEAHPLAKPEGAGGQVAESYLMPASTAQERFWMLEQIAPGNPALHMRACVRLTGKLSLDALEKGLQLLVARHEILRTTFESMDGEVLQVIAKTGNLSLDRTSLSHLSGDELETRLGEEVRQEAGASFDLVRGPLLRARLFELQPDEHVLIVTAHHILVDGWSQNVIQKELWSAYEEFAAGREPSPAPLPIQYADFAHWQREWLASDQAKTELEFWKRKLAPPLPVVELPTDHNGRHRPGTRGAMETLLLDDALVRSLKALAQSQQVTMFMLMLAAFAALLGRTGDQPELIIGSPVANRKPETEALIGPFAGPVSLRINLGGDPTFRDLLARVREVALDALSHVELPFEVLMQELQVRSVRGRNPLSQFYFFYQTAFLQPRQLPGLTVTPLPDFALGTHFELQLGLLERREGLRAQLEYNPDLFHVERAQRILEDYRKVLETVTLDPGARIADLPIAVRRQTATPAPSPRLAAVTPAVLDKTERRLVRIWEEVLGAKPIGRSDNYFDLGGTSVLAVRLFSAIAKEFKVRLPLATLFETQTVEEMAQLLRLEEPDVRWSPLVEIQRGGRRPPFFCVHGGGGNVLIYRDLARHLGPEQPVYGLQCQGLDGQRPLLTRIEDMASLYVREIVRKQPSGPYYLGGYCMGGTIALEMAQQLHAQGREVVLLALFDTLNWCKMLRKVSMVKQAWYEMQRVGFHVGNFLLLDSRNKFRFFRDKLKDLRSRSRVWLGMLLSRIAGQQPGSNSESRLLAQIWQTNDRAAVEYVPRPYAGVITHFRPMTQYSKYLSPGTGWKELALGGEHIVELPVYPAGMMLQPFVKDLAKGVRSQMDEAITVAQNQEHGRMAANAHEDSMNPLVVNGSVR